MSGFEAVAAFAMGVLVTLALTAFYAAGAGTRKRNESPSLTEKLARRIIDSSDAGAQEPQTPPRPGGETSVAETAPAQHAGESAEAAPDAPQPPSEAIEPAREEAISTEPSPEPPASSKPEPVEAASEEPAPSEEPFDIEAALTSILEEAAESENPKSALVVDMDNLAKRLFHANDPIALLKHEVGRIRTAEAKAKDGKGPEPSAVASYLARGLDEAGLFEREAAWPSMTVVRPSRAKTFYLRIDERSFAWPNMVRVLAVEGALNRALFAWEHFERDRGEGEEPASIEDCYRFNQALASSICAQTGSTPIGHASMSDIVGEWGARQAIAAGIESFRLPLRLQAQFRVNLMGGDAAIVATHVPWQAQPASGWSEELGRIVMATKHMRLRAASDYAMRVALLLASHAFRSSKRLCHVYVAVVLSTPRRRSCILSGNVSRETLAEMDLTGSFDARAACRRLGFSMRLEAGVLSEVPQGFSLESERFCPSTRYDSPDLSERLLPRFESALLGAERVNDLAINENARRDVMAGVACRALVPSTERSVRAILDLTRNDIDPTVRAAGERCARALIEGRVSPDDVLGFSQEFVFGDALTRACDKAGELLQAGEAADAARVLTDALAPIDALDTYTDTEDVTWRDFMSYVERALYNRLLAEEGREVRLVPDAYYNAQALMATALMATGRTEQALGFARRVQGLAPLNMPGTLRVVRCLEQLGRKQEAADELRHGLEFAFDPEGVGVGYYRLAYMEWQLGNYDVADACYQKALTCHSSITTNAMLELQALRMHSGTGGVSPEDVEDTLERAGIPLAPTERVLTVLVEAAQGATDAEVFPVARSFATLLRLLSGDDVMSGVLASLEHEPDR